MLMLGQYCTEIVLRKLWVNQISSGVTLRTHAGVNVEMMEKESVKKTQVVVQVTRLTGANGLGEAERRP